MFNFKLPTPEELKEDQIERYTEMLKNPLSSDHKKFLKSQLKNLHNGNDRNNSHGNRNSDHLLFTRRHRDLLNS